MKCALLVQLVERSGFSSISRVSIGDIFQKRHSADCTRMRNNNCNFVCDWSVIKVRREQSTFSGISQLQLEGFFMPHITSNCACMLQLVGSLRSVSNGGQCAFVTNFVFGCVSASIEVSFLEMHTLCAANSVRLVVSIK